MHTPDFFYLKAIYAQNKKNCLRAGAIKKKDKYIVVNPF